MYKAIFKGKFTVYLDSSGFVFSPSRNEKILPKHIIDNSKQAQNLISRGLLEVISIDDMDNNVNENTLNEVEENSRITVKGSLDEAPKDIFVRVVEDELITRVEEVELVSYFDQNKVAEHQNENNDIQVDEKELNTVLDSSSLESIDVVQEESVEQNNKELIDPYSFEGVLESKDDDQNVENSESEFLDESFSENKKRVFSKKKNKNN
jgi:hypothetical protein